MDFEYFPINDGIKGCYFTDLNMLWVEAAHVVWFQVDRLAFYNFKLMVNVQNVETDTVDGYFVAVWQHSASYKGNELSLITVIDDVLRFNLNVFNLETAS